MFALTAVTLLGAIACIQAGAIGLAGSIDSAAIIAGPSGTIKRTGLASVGPVASTGAIITGSAGLGASGLITAGVAPGAILTGPGLGLGGLGLGGLGAGGLGLGLGLAGPGLAARALGLEGSGIEGQYVPDLNEKLYDDGSYKPGLYGH